MSTARLADDENTGGEVDTTPLLSGQISRSRQFIRRPHSLRGAARFLRRASSRRMMREPSIRVREAAAEQLEERQSDWAYSKPIVLLDFLWNFAFAMVSISVLVLSRNENPSMPLRLWILGYCLQCVVHMLCVCVEYYKRLQYRNLSGSLRRGNSGSIGGGERWVSGNSSSGSDEGEHLDYSSDQRSNDDETSVIKHIKSANTMFSFLWWIIGFYWISAGGQILPRDSPQLYWFAQANLPSMKFNFFIFHFPTNPRSSYSSPFCRLCVVFLAFDVLFVVICVAVACVIGIAVCCCLPCIIAILYAVADQEGATKEDIERLPKYRFRRIGDFKKQNGEIQRGIMIECDTDTPTEHVLPLEDDECSICLCTYDDGAELRELPCRHHFHCACIDKWLHINATCPLCKYNILKNGNHSGDEEA